MKLGKRMKHFIGAITGSYVSIITGFALMLGALLILHVSPFQNDEQTLAFFVGIIASIIATLVIKISDRYFESISANSRIIKQVNLFITFIENTQDKKDSEFRFELWKDYICMCDTSAKLLYKEDFYQISKAASDVIEAIYTNQSDQYVKNEIQTLAVARNDAQML